MMSHIRSMPDVIVVTELERPGCPLYDLYEKTLARPQGEVLAVSRNEVSGVLTVRSTSRPCDFLFRRIARKLFFNRPDAP